MAIVTVELRNLLKTSNFSLFDFTYPCDDPQFKEELEQAITDYYFFYEIGSPTPDHFKHQFRSTVQRIMVYYNKLYNTTLLEYEPLINYKMTEALNQLSSTNASQSGTSQATSTGTNEGTTQTTNTGANTNEGTSTSTTTGTGTSTNTNTDSDYPQHVAGADYQSSKQAGNGTTTNDTTTTGATSDEGTTSNTSTGSSTGGSSDTTSGTSEQTGTNSTNTNYDKVIEGITGVTYQDLIMKERSNLLRITDMVIKELKPLFILVY